MTTATVLFTMLLSFTFIFLIASILFYFAEDEIPINKPTKKLYVNRSDNFISWNEL